MQTPQNIPGKNDAGIEIVNIVKNKIYIKTWTVCYLNVTLVLLYLWPFLFILWVYKISICS